MVYGMRQTRDFTSEILHIFQRFKVLTHEFSCFDPVSCVKCPSNLQKGGLSPYDVSIVLRQPLNPY